MKSCFTNRACFASSRSWRDAIVLLAAPALLAQAPTQFVNRSSPAMLSSALREAAVADLDGDGDLDLCGGLSPFAFGIRQAMLRNDGQEQWVDVTASNLPASSIVTLATIAFDLEGDGDVDLFVSKQQAPSRLWRNNGAGVFTDASATLPTVVTDHLSGVARDFDGDGDTDLVLMGGYFSVSQDQLLLNNGAGIFTALPLWLGGGSTSITAADIDVDGDQDLVLGTQSGPRAHRNDGSSTFTDVTATWLASTPTNIVLSVALGDTDGDGDPDLALGRQNAADLILSNTGSGFAVTGSLAGNFSGTKSCVLFDCDEDGDLDLARGSISGTVSLALNDGTGAFVTAPSRLPSVGSWSPNLRVGDFDRDGDRDLLVLEEVAPASPNRQLVNRHRDLVAGPATIGLTFTVDVASEPGYAALHHVSRLGIGLAGLAQPLVVPGFGELWVDLNASYFVAEAAVLASVGIYGYTFAVPPLPQLVGLPLHVQAVVEQARGPAHFTAYRRVVIQ